MLNPLDKDAKAVLAFVHYLGFNVLNALELYFFDNCYSYAPI